jgi:hypothetical protein
MPEIEKPSFFIVGAAKAGTTSVADYLAQHPDVYFSPVKEPNYFASDIDQSEFPEAVLQRLKAQDLDQVFRSKGQQKLHRAFIKDEATYLKLFSFAGENQVCGEASPSYLYSQTAANNIARFNPAAKIIIILREPASRAYSHYLMNLRLTFEEGSFEEALAKDAATPTTSWGSRSLYRELGFYKNQVERYLQAFPREQILILLHEDLSRNTGAVMQEVMRFLKINPEAELNYRQSNSAIVPRNQLLRKLLAVHTLQVKMSYWLGKGPLKKLLKKFFYKKPEGLQANPETLQQLRSEFRSDIEQLEKLTGLVLDNWKK